MRGDRMVLGVFGMLVFMMVAMLVVALVNSRDLRGVFIRCVEQTGKALECRAAVSGR